MPVGRRRPGDDPPPELRIALYRSSGGFEAVAQLPTNQEVEWLAGGEDLATVLAAADRRLDELAAAGYEPGPDGPARLSEPEVRALVPGVDERIARYRSPAPPPPPPPPPDPRPGRPRAPSIGGYFDFYGQDVEVRCASCGWLGGPEATHADLEGHVVQARCPACRGVVAILDLR